MKRIVFLFTLIAALSACNSAEKKKAEDTKTYHEVGVENVNGNIPDTTNSINLTHQLDTLHKTDSAK